MSVFCPLLFVAIMPVDATRQKTKRREVLNALVLLYQKNKATQRANLTQLYQGDGLPDAVLEERIGFACAWDQAQEDKCMNELRELNTGAASTAVVAGPLEVGPTAENAPAKASALVTGSAPAKTSKNAKTSQAKRGKAKAPIVIPDDDDDDDADEEGEEEEEEEEDEDADDDEEAENEEEEEEEEEVARPTKRSRAEGRLAMMGYAPLIDPLGSGTRILKGDYRFPQRKEYVKLVATLSALKSKRLLKWSMGEYMGGGNNFYDMLENPYEHPKLMRFIFDEPFRASQLHGFEPWLARFNVIINDNASRWGYQMLLTTLAKGEYRYGSDCCGMLGEVIGMFIGGGAQSGNSIPLRSFMLMAQINRAEAACAGARTWAEDLEAPVLSATSMAMKAGRMTFTWAHPDLPDSVVTGEGLARRADYVRALVTTQRAALRHDSFDLGGFQLGGMEPRQRRMQSAVSEVSSRMSRARTIRPSDSASNVGSNVQTVRAVGTTSAAGSGVLARIPPAANPVTGSRRHQNNPMSVTGFIDVGNRCMRCGKVGHGQDDCPGPDHPKFTLRPRSYLLNEMSWGRIPLP